MDEPAREPRRSADAGKRRGENFDLEDDVAFAASVVPQAVIDSRGIIARANRAFAELFGARFVAGTPLVGVASFADTAAIWRALRERRMREPMWRIDVECDLALGRRSLELTFRRLAPRREPMLAVSVADVTERVEATRDVRRAHERELTLRAHFEALAKASARLLDASAPNTPLVEALPHILHAAMDALDARRAAIVVLAKSSDDVVAWTGDSTCPVPHLADRMDGAGVVRSAGGAHVARLLPIGPSEARVPAARARAHVSSMSSPLNSPAGPRGLLYVYDRGDGGEFTADDQSLLDSLASRAAPLIDVVAFRQTMNGEHGWLSIAFERSSEAIAFIHADGAATLNKQARSVLGASRFGGRHGHLQPPFVDAAGNEIAAADHPVVRGFRGASTTARALRLGGGSVFLDVVVDASPVRGPIDGAVAGVVLFFRSVGDRDR